MKTEEQKDRDHGTIFMTVCMILLLLGIIHIARDAAKQQREFTAECKALGGEVAKQPTRLICVAPQHILRHMSQSHKQEFKSDCVALKGEFAKQKSDVICVDPHLVMREVSGSYDHSL